MKKSLQDFMNSLAKGLTAFIKESFYVKDFMDNLVMLRYGFYSTLYQDYQKVISTGGKQDWPNDVWCDARNSVKIMLTQDRNRSRADWTADRIGRCLNVSLGHISDEANEKLLKETAGTNCIVSDKGEIAIYSMPYVGYVVLLCLPTEDTILEEMTSLFNFCEENGLCSIYPIVVLAWVNGCARIHLDTEGQEFSQLPSYDW